MHLLIPLDFVEHFENVLSVDDLGVILSIGSMRPIKRRAWGPLKSRHVLGPITSAMEHFEVGLTELSRFAKGA